MSLNVSGSKYIKVYDPTIRLAYSDKVLWANLVSSRKTGVLKVDGETEEIVINPNTGKEVQERAFSRWEAKFVGNAFEPSKFLKDGDSIDIVTGWVTNEKFVGKDGSIHTKVVLTVSDFQPSNISESEES